MTRVKICGITSIEDAFAAVDAGADAIGFVFAPSPRQVDSAKAKRIADALPPFVSRVGVFVNADPSVLRDASDCGLDTAQLHGEQSDLFAQLLAPHIRIIRVLRIKDEETLAGIKTYPAADAYLLDTFSEKALGGTGKSFDWQLAVKAKQFGKPVILSGGLNPDNVEEAIRLVRPYAVDVSSGVESSPGKKDHDKIKELVNNVRKADQTP